jgi:hypothetical protein
LFRKGGGCARRHSAPRLCGNSVHAPAACAPLLLSHRPLWLRARSYAVYAVLAFQILAWGYITQNPTPRLQRKAWLDMVIYGCYVSLPLAAGLACLGSTATPRLRVHARGPATGQAMDVVGLIGTNRGMAGFSMVPWIVAAVAKLVNLIAESIYGAVGHYTLFIVSLVFTHWGAHM